MIVLAVSPLFMGGGISDLLFRRDHDGRGDVTSITDEGRYLLGRGSGLNKHHLPQATVQWLKNLKAVIKGKFY